MSRVAAQQVHSRDVDQVLPAEAGVPAGTPALAGSNLQNQLPSSRDRAAAQLAKSALRIKATHRGEERQKTFYKPSVLVGRNNGASEPDFDLSIDNTVSRSHARIWIEEGMCWIEDLGSKFGTKVGGEDIRGRGKVRVSEASTVQVGETALKVEGTVESANGFPELAPQPNLASTVEIDETTNNRAGRLILPKSTSLEAVQTQNLLLEILVQFSLPSPLDQLLQTIIGRVVDLIPGAKRGTLLLRNPETDGLLLAAFVSPCEPAVSETLARRALKQQQAFVWRNTFGSEHALSIHRHQIQSGMYAPLIYDGCPLGVICVDNPDSDSAFSQADVQLLVTVADHAAVAVSHHQLQEKLSNESKLLEPVLAQFSPNVRHRLREKERLGQLRPSAEKSDVTFLFAEFRDFKSQTTQMAVPEVLKLLNDYFPALTEPVFRFDGTIDNFQGNSVLALFGSPEPDPDQHQNAIRAAWSMQQAVQEINRKRAAAGQPSCQMSIGIHCGEAIHGFVGSSARCEFAVVGEAVEASARYCRMAEDGEILLSESVYKWVSKSVIAEKTVRSTGHEPEIVAWRVKGLAV